MNDVETKLAAARTRLILDKPFLGALVLRLPMRQADPDWCPTVATDARAFYYSVDYIDALKVEQVQFVLAHEALHCALSHFARRGHRIKHRWDIACDHAINPLLMKEGLQGPPGTWYDDGFLGMTAEEIYPMIDDNDQQETMDRHVYDEEDKNDGNQQTQDAGLGGDRPKDSGGGQGQQNQDKSSAQPQPNEEGEDQGAPQPQPLNYNEQAQLEVQWRQRLAGAAQQALQANKLGGDMARLVDHLLQPRLPWRNLLAHYLSMSARDDYTYMRPSRREGTAIFPSLRSQQVEICVAVDISGSVHEDEMGEFFAEVNALKGQLRARVSILACDTALTEDSPFVFEPWDTIRLPDELQGGGGTSFVPVFEWVQTQDRQPDVLVYFTDAEGEFPDHAPNYPVLWLVKGREPVPWGQRIQLN
jgi:predicted metal-dependent peptidase